MIIFPCLSPFGGLWQIDRQRWMLSTDCHLESRYRGLLLQCISQGDWAGALRVYDSMLKWRCPISQATFRHIIRCCRLAKPVRSDIGTARHTFTPATTSRAASGWQLWCHPPAACCFAPADYDVLLLPMCMVVCLSRGGADGDGAARPGPRHPLPQPRARLLPGWGALEKGAQGRSCLLAQPGLTDPAGGSRLRGLSTGWELSLLVVAAAAVPGDDGAAGRGAQHAHLQPAA